MLGFQLVSRCRFGPLLVGSLLFLFALGCGSEQEVDPPVPGDASPSITGSAPGAPGGKSPADAGGPAVDPEQAIIGTWILDNAAMERRVRTDAKYANLDKLTKDQLATLVGEMAGSCTLDGEKISIAMSAPGRPEEPPQVGRYRILKLEGKKLQIIMTDEAGVDDRADAVLDGDRLFVTFDGETMEFTRKK